MIYTKGPNHDLRFLLSLARVLDTAGMSIIIDTNDIVRVPYRKKEFNVYNSQFVTHNKITNISTDLNITITNCYFLCPISI